MHVLTEIVIGAAVAAVVLNRLRTAGTGTPRISLRQQDTFRPAVTRPPIRAGIGLDPDPASQMYAPSGSDTPGRHPRETSWHARLGDSTQAMMDAMSGPGVCTPRP